MNPNQKYSNMKYFSAHSVGERNHNMHIVKGKLELHKIEKANMTSY